MGEVQRDRSIESAFGHAPRYPQELPGYLVGHRRIAGALTHIVYGDGGATLVHPGRYLQTLVQGLPTDKAPRGPQKDTPGASASR